VSTITSSFKHCRFTHSVDADTTNISEITEDSGVFLSAMHLKSLCTMRMWEWQVCCKTQVYPARSQWSVKEQGDECIREILKPTKSKRATHKQEIVQAHFRYKELFLISTDLLVYCIRNQPYLPY